MVCGFDRYFQIARCFRDEDLRYDRQPEFTQIDLEAAFVGQEGVLGLVEAVLVALWEEAGHAIGRPFQRLTHREAMERYGTDKPDQRYDLAIADWTAHVRSLGVPFFQSIMKDGSRVRGLAVKGGGALSRKDVDQLAEAAKQLGAAGLAWVKRQGEQISGSVGKHFTTETLGRLGVRGGRGGWAVPPSPGGGRGGGGRGGAVSQGGGGGGGGRAGGRSGGLGEARPGSRPPPGAWWGGRGGPPVRRSWPRCTSR